MSEQEMLQRIKELELENQKLKNRTNVKMKSGIVMNIRNLEKLAFLFPYYCDKLNGQKVNSWRTKVPCSSPNFSNLRNVAVGVIDELNAENNSFTKQNLNSVCAEDASIAISCCEEIVDVLTKYKIQYLQKQGCNEFLKVFQDAGVIELE